MSLAPEWLYGRDRLFALLLAGFAIELIFIGLLGFQQVLGLPRAVTVNVAAQAGIDLVDRSRNVVCVDGVAAGCHARNVWRCWHGSPAR